MRRQEVGFMYPEDGDQQTGWVRNMLRSSASFASAFLTFIRSCVGWVVCSVKLYGMQRELKKGFGELGKITYAIMLVESKVDRDTDVATKVEYLLSLEQKLKFTHQKRDGYSASITSLYNSQ